MRLDKNVTDKLILAELQDFATKAPRRAARVWRDFVGKRIIHKAKSFLGSRGPTEPAFSWGTWQRIGANRNWSWVPHSLPSAAISKTVRPLHPRTTSIGYGLATRSRPYWTLPLYEDGGLEQFMHLSPVNFRGAGGLGAIFTISVDASYAYKQEYGGTSDAGNMVRARPFMRPAIFWFENDAEMNYELRLLLNKQFAYYAKNGDTVR